MKTKSLRIVTLLLFFYSTHTFAQVDSLMNLYIDTFDSSGIVYYKANTVLPGEPFTIYSSFFLPNNPNHNMLLKEQWSDDILNFDHYYYEQYYYGLRVESMTFIEHVSNGKIKYANGKLGDLTQDYTVLQPLLLSETDAYNTLINTLEWEGDIEWAWEDENWEQWIRTVNKDSNATFNPLGQGELLWAIDNPIDLTYLNPDGMFVLCWKFSLSKMDLLETKEYFVNAITGNIFKEKDASLHATGTADTEHYGTLDIETTLKGIWPFQKYQLYAEIGSNSYEVRDGNDNIKYWADCDKVKDSDNDWDNLNDRNAYSIHAFVGYIWDNIETDFNWVGPSNGRRDNVLQFISNYGGNRIGQLPVPGGGATLIAFSDKDNKVTDPEADIETVAHEYAHTILSNGSKLGTGYEAGSLMESFCDIIALKIEYDLTGTTNWKVFEASSIGREQRDFANPKARGVHYTNPACTTLTIGQPNTYKGDYFVWSHFTCYGGGIHVNCGISNYWFYLLANGGTGTNDKSKTYSVNGIGIDKALDVVWHTWMNDLQITSNFADCRKLTIQTAKELYGECSNEYKQVINAWYAVNVGDPHNCPANNINSQNNFAFFDVYPNPTNGIINLIIPQNENVVIEVIGLNGAILKQYHNANQINVSDLDKGSYILRFNMKGIIRNFNIILI